MIQHDIKVVSFIIDALNALVTECVIAARGRNSQDVKIIVGVFGGVYGIVSIIHYAVHVVYQYHNDSSKVGKVAFLNSLLLLSSWAYFAGDNLHVFATEDEGLRVASVTLLFFGLAGFRLIPVLPSLKDKPEENPEGQDEENDSLHHTIINMLHLVPEIDGWFTHFTMLIALTEMSDGSGTNNCSVLMDNDSAIDDESTCPAGYIAAVWSIYGFIVVATVFQLGYTFYCFFKPDEDEENPDKDEENKFQNRFQLILAGCMCIIVSLFLIGDNGQPLDCLFSCSSWIDNVIRIVFIVISLAITTVLLIIAVKSWKDLVSEEADQTNLVSPMTQSEIGKVNTSCNHSLTITNLTSESTLQLT